MLEDGKAYNTKYYNLDAIISVGCRINSIKATAILPIELSCCRFRSLFLSGMGSCLVGGCSIQPFVRQNEK